ncbi:hypothetical protein GF407_03985 [candidate division KSB1 bacterium]|nr:hypothetical protein [candidate division KSB1 bacterium]
MSRTFSTILEKISDAVAGIFDIVELQVNVMDLCQDIFDAEACSLFLFNKAGELNLVAARGFTRKFIGHPPLFIRGEHFDAGLNRILQVLRCKPG